jgi:hypothetical protein
MQPLESALSAPFKLLGLVPKMPKLPSPLPVPTTDDAAAQISTQDELARRRGGAADVITGSGGAEAGATGKALLGQ